EGLLTAEPRRGVTVTPLTAADVREIYSLRHALENLAIELASGTRRAVRVDVGRLAPDTSDASREAVLRTLVPGEVSDVTRDTLANAESPQHLVALTLGSPEFQRR
ncbi:MAG: hypothetical protein ACLGHP_07740, partial [Vicinamibacteria bacterium]